MPAAVLELQQLSFAYDNQVVVQAIDLSVAGGEIVGLLGPSGSGKTSLLRLIAGLERPSGGQIILRGQKVADSQSEWVPPEQRRLALVQQDYALFPHLTVAKNIGFGLRNLSREEHNTKLDSWLRRVNLQGKNNRLPNELSGGEQQRVAIARALITEPDLVLLDEPFSNLDSHLRQQLGQQLKDWLQLSETAAVFVTHDQSEAMQLADRVAVLHRGELQQTATPQTLIDTPSNEFVAEFVGGGRWLELNHHQGSLSCILGSFDASDLNPEQPYRLLVRNTDLIPDVNGICATVVSTQLDRGYWHCLLRLPDATLVGATFAQHVGVTQGAEISIARAPGVVPIIMPTTSAAGSQS